MRNELDYLLMVACWWGYDRAQRFARLLRSIACAAQDRRFGAYRHPDDEESPF